MIRNQFGSNLSPIYPFSPGMPAMTPIMPENIELARAYVPYQQYVRSFTPEDALNSGTMFPELYSPYGDKHEKHMENRGEQE